MQTTQQRSERRMRKTTTTGVHIHRGNGESFTLETEWLSSIVTIQNQKWRIANKKWKGGKETNQKNKKKSNECKWENGIDN